MKIYILLHVHMLGVCADIICAYACFFACVDDNPCYYSLPYVGELFDFFFNCCCSPFAAVLCLLHRISGHHKLQIVLCCVDGGLK